MNIFQIINKLYTDKSSKWIIELEDSMISPFVIQKFLCMNDRIRKQTRWLDKYVFYLSPKMYLSLAWSIIPKMDRPPYVKFIKGDKEEEELDFLIVKIRKHLQLGDNDYNSVKHLLLKSIKDNMTEWFTFYGVEKQYWKKYKLDFDLIKTLGTKRKKPQQGLAKWGM